MLRLPNLRNRTFFAADLVLVTVSPWIAYVIRFEGIRWTPLDAETLSVYTALSVPLKLGVLLALGLYRHLWRHASVTDLLGLLRAVLVSAAACSALGIVLLPVTGLTPVRVPISVAVLDAFLTAAGVVAPRLLLKALATWSGGRRAERGKRTLIVGAGAGGEMILRELRANPRLELAPAAFVDDDPAKQGHVLGGVPILGPLAEIPAIVKRQEIREVVIAMPTAPGSVIRDVVRAAADAGVPTRTVPGLFEIVSGRVGISNLRKVEIQDLLRRDSVRTDLAAVRALVSDRTVLVTGAGGSIGSELCRQLACLKPAQLVLLGNLENEVFDILHELTEAHPGLALTPVIADVRDLRRTQAVFERFRPDTVLHAAAHKHVPLMEGNVVEAVTNNVLGTRNVVDCAVAVGTASFVLISTDKAVRPTSVMGATKRVAELVVQRAARLHGRHFVSVRFGNVLGSRCSVVPIFLQQIERGGPVTVTHPEMRRYFMTIPEAVHLVLQAATLGRGGEVFVLDMGEPVRIVDLAADLIRLSGLRLGADIQIRYTGIRPGERLHEEMFTRGEDVVPTEHPKILCARNDRRADGPAAQINALIAVAQQCAPDGELRARLRGLLPDFRPARDGGPQIAGSPPGAAEAVVGGPSSEHQDHPFVERRSGRDRRRGERRLRAIIVGPRFRRRQRERRNGGERRSGRERRMAGALSEPVEVAAG